MFRQLKLSSKIFMLGTIIIICFSICMVVNYVKLKTDLMDYGRRDIKKVVEVAYALLPEYDARAKAGEFSLDEAKKRAARRIKTLRYSKDDYFWINDMGPKMIMHPFKPELDGTDLSNNQDPKGKRLFIEFVNVCKEKGEGFVDYMWPKPGFPSRSRRFPT